MKANIFVHFKPLVHDELNRLDDEERILRGEPISINRHHGRLRSNQAAPPSSRRISDDEVFRTAASRGELAEVRRLLEAKGDLLNKQDENGWQAIHEAVRAGHTNVVKYLIDRGADINHKVKSGESLMSLAKEHLPDGHAIEEILISAYAPEDLR